MPAIETGECEPRFMGFAEGGIQIFAGFRISAEPGTRSRSTGDGIGDLSPKSGAA